MLSRVAERVYWGARYLERAENTARLINVYSHLLLDVPSNTDLDWYQIVDITGAADDFKRCKVRRRDERSIVGFLLTRENHSGSILATLGAARENFRTIRDIVPTEGWRCVNELYLYARRDLKRAVSQRRRNKVLGSIISQCQQITGLLAGTMSHGDAYQFLRIGRNLERGDMSSRIIDVAAATFLNGTDTAAQVENALWMNVLRSLSAYQMYRQYVRRRITPEDVLEFLLTDMDFPRTVLHCLHEVEASIKPLPNHDKPLQHACRSIGAVKQARVTSLVGPSLHEFIDHLQLDFARIHDQISAAWFSPKD